MLAPVQMEPVHGSAVDLPLLSAGQLYLQALVRSAPLSVCHAAAGSLTGLATQDLKVGLWGTFDQQEQEGRRCRVSTKTNLPTLILNKLDHITKLPQQIVTPPAMVLEN